MVLNRLIWGETRPNKQYARYRGTEGRTPVFKQKRNEIQALRFVVPKQK